jgi:hypothetical protein
MSRERSNRPTSALHKAARSMNRMLSRETHIQRTHLGKQASLRSRTCFLPPPRPPTV